MRRSGVIQRHRGKVIKDLKETTLSLGILGDKYGVTRQALSLFVKKEKIKRKPRRHRPVKHRVEACHICQEILRVGGQPHSEFFSRYTIQERLGAKISPRQYLYHLNVLRKRRAIDVIPHEVIEEIFPKKLKRVFVSREVSDQLKKMILKGKMMKGQRLKQERIAFRFDVSQTAVIGGLSRLKKEGLVTRRQGLGWVVK